MQALTDPDPAAPGLADEDAVSAAYSAHGPELYRFVLRGLGDSGAAQDVVQETFLRAWRAADRFDPQLASLRVWLFAIARNAMLDHARAAKVRPWQTNLVDPPTVEQSGPAVDDVSDSLVRSWVVEEAMRRLSPEHRAALVETHLRERPYAEVAADLGIPLGTLRSRVFYGLKSPSSGDGRDGSDTVTGPDASEHRQLRELLGAHALGALPEGASAALKAHLDGCATCRAELAEIAPLAQELRFIHPDALALQPSPPADLGERIRAGIAAERALVEARARRERSQHRARRVMGAAAAVAVLGLALGLGTALGRSTAPAVVARPGPTASAPALPIEQVAVRAVDAAVSTQQAQIIAHTWGVEARFTGTGFRVGQVYRAAFRSADGRLLPAGEFLGTGAKELKCNMQSALLRPDTTGFVVTDEAGAQVLMADL